MPTVFNMFERRPTQLKRPVRTSKALCSLSGWVDDTRPSSAYKYAAGSMIFRPSPPAPYYDGVTTVTQWRMTASTITLKIVGDRGVALHDISVPLERASEVPAVFG